MFSASHVLMLVFLASCSPLTCLMFDSFKKHVDSERTNDASNRRS